MGSGKSTLGKKLAAKAGMPFIDLDLLIEEKEGRSIEQIFAEAGEAYFRKVEADTLRGIDTGVSAVVATGGGTPCHSDNMDYMNSAGITVYLRMPPAALALRLRNRKEQRPLLAGLGGDNILQYISKKIGEREPFYMKSVLVYEGSGAGTDELWGLIAEYKGRNENRH